MAGQKRFMRLLLKQQLLFYGRVGRAADDDPVRKATFMPGSLEPVTSHFVRRQGRPQNELAPQFYKEAIRAVKAADLLTLMKKEAMLEKAVNVYLDM